MVESRRPWLVFVCGVLACAAAMAKLAVPMPDWFACWVPMAHEAWGTLLLVELGVGAAMVAWHRSATAWSLGVVFFATVGAISAVLAWQNYSSCRCFGPIDLKPTFMASGDALLLVALLIGWPSNLRRTIGTIATIAVILAATAVAVGGAAEGVRRWKSARQGYEFPPVIRLGDIDASSRTEFRIRIVNRSTSPMEFRSLEAPNARFSVEIPFTIPANTSRSIDATFDTGTRTGRFCGTVLYRFIHRDRLRRATSRLSGNIRARTSGSSDRSAEADKTTSFQVTK